MPLLQVINILQEAAGSEGVKKVMNFMPTKIKSLASFFAAFLIGILAYSSSGCFDCSKETIQSIKFQTTIQGFVIGFLVIYVIWSFIEKRK